MAVTLILRITASDAKAMEAALASLAETAEDRDFDAEGIADDFGTGYTEAGFTIAASVEEGM